MLPAITATALAITMNGRPLAPAPRTVVIAGTTYLPVRDLGRALGADIRYDAATRAVIATYHGTSSTLHIGNGLPLIGGHVYAPLRAVASIFHIGVAYDGPTRTIALTSATAEMPSYAHASNVATASQPALVTPKFPQSGAQVLDSYPAISAIIATQGGADIDPGAIHLLIDGNDVSANASVIGNQIVYTPRTPLSNGQHNVQVDGVDRSGVPFSGQWSFTSNYSPPNMTSSGGISAGSFGGLQSVYIDRAVGASDRYFDVVAYGPPGGYGNVTIDGVPGIYNLVPYGANRYVAQVTLPFGIDQPFARANVHFVGAGGQASDFTLPTTFQIYTIYRGRQFAPPPATPHPANTPGIDPGMPRRNVVRPTPVPIPHRVPLTNATARPVITPVPAVRPTVTAAPITPLPIVTPAARKRRILGTPRPIPTPTPVPKPVASP